jgi:hypothetical protein
MLHRAFSRDPISRNRVVCHTAPYPQSGNGTFMKQFLSIAALCSMAVCRAGPEERAILAAMALSERPSYSWTSTIADDASTYHVEGKTERGGFTWVRLPAVKSIAERLGRNAEPEVEAIFKGSTNAVIRTDRGWQSLSELPTRAGRDDDGPDPQAPRMRHTGMIAIGGLYPVSVIALHGGLGGDDRSASYSNAQFGASHPHEELAVIVSSFTDVQGNGDVVTGTLSDVGARLLLVSTDQENILPLRAAGTFRLQIANGIVVRYSVQLEGILLVNRKKIHVHQTASTELKAIGSTNLHVPEEVRRKLAP